MKVSIVIPAFNEEKLIERTLTAVASASHSFKKRAWTVETVVCDNNSTDRTAELARIAGAVVVFEPINQISRARNAGAGAATGDWLVFIDADSVPDALLFEKVSQLITDGKTIGGGCLLRLDEDVTIGRVIVSIWNLVSLVTRWAAGSFIFCEASVFRKLGGFSSKLYASEELEFSARLKRVARAERRRVSIIRTPKLITSARKMHLYSQREHGRFFLKALFQPSKMLTDRARCALWYDGRR